jgi:LPXTG-motif cell wall-anchored protein
VVAPPTSLPTTGGDAGNVLRLATLTAMLGLAMWIATRRKRDRIVPV